MIDLASMTDADFLLLADRVLAERDRRIAKANGMPDTLYTQGFSGDVLHAINPRTGQAAQFRADLDTMRRFRAPRLSDPTKSVDFVFEDLGDTEYMIKNGETVTAYSSRFVLDGQDVISQVSKLEIDNTGDAAGARYAHDTKFLAAHDIDWNGLERI